MTARVEVMENNGKGNSSLKPARDDVSTIIFKRFDVSKPFRWQRGFPQSSLCDWGVCKAVHVHVHVHGTDSCEALRRI